jgi:hypothetical protein
MTQRHQTSLTLDSIKRSIGFYAIERYSMAKKLKERLRTLDTIKHLIKRLGTERGRCSKERRQDLIGHGTKKLSSLTSNRFIQKIRPLN